MIAVAVVAIPLVAALVSLVPILRRHGRWVNTTAAAVTGALTLLVLVTGAESAARAPWMASLGVEYVLVLDRLGALLLAVSSLLFGICAATSRRVADARAYHALLAVLASAVGGVLVSRDLVLFFVFWELALLAVVLLAERWGGARGVPSAGGLLVVDAILLVAVASIVAIRGTADVAALAERPLTADAQRLPLLLMLPAIAARLGVFPLHALAAPLEERVPDAAAPFATAALMLGGATAFVRVALPLFPDALGAYAPVLVALAAVGAAYGAAIAVRGRGARAVGAWVVRSQRNVAALGLLTATAGSLGGAVLVLVSAAPSFAAVVIAAAGPRRTAGWGLAALAAIAAAPLTGGFAGTVLVLAAGYARYPVAMVVAASAFALWGFAALALARGQLQGPLAPRTPASARDALVLAALLAMVVVAGTVPAQVTDLIPPRILDPGAAP